MNEGEEGPSSLLDPRGSGWKLKMAWPGLFRLYVKGEEAMAELSTELQAIENNLSRGHSRDDKDAPKLERALFLLALFALGKREGDNCSSFGFDSFRKLIVEDLSDTLGSLTLRLLSEKTHRTAELAKTNVVSLVKRAASGLIRIKYPGAARGSGDLVPKEILAIWHARGLCEHFRRLPTKREVRARLEIIGITYGKTKDLAGKWRSLFSRAGLATLPD